MREQILIVDDELSMRDFLAIMLEKESYTVEVADSGAQALRIMDRTDFFDLVISDIRMPDMDGLELLRRIKTINPEIPIIIITAFASTETAIEALKLGAFDYVTKPFKVDEMKRVVSKALTQSDLRAQYVEVELEPSDRSQLGSLIGRSPKMKRIFDTIRKVVSQPSTILVTGESGTGKELVARAIHEHGDRRDHPFVPVNCGAIPETLLESELFGHMKGSFTGAIENKKGLFELADRGTFFLDEVGETSPAIQVKLLRVLNDHKFKRIGGIRDIEVDVRIIAATNQDLEEAVRNGSFRQDLYYRLNVIPIRMPALRERTEDIPLLADHFLEFYSSRSGCPRKSLTQPAQKLLTEYHWPGNVRELENVVERTVALEADEIIAPHSLPSEIRYATHQKVFPSVTFPEDGVDLDQALSNFEKEYILAALDRTEGAKKRAAELLGISFRSLRYRIEKLGLERDVPFSGEHGRDRTVEGG